MVEKLVHRLWLGPKPMPERYVEFGKQWKAMNPDWQVIEWTRKTIPPMRNQEILNDIAKRPRSSIPMDFDRAVAVQQSDVIYYELLEQFGGICLNVDIEPLRPLSTLIDIVGDKSWASFEDDYWLVNCAYGGVKGDSFWRALIDYLPVNYRLRYDEYMQHQTGPHLLTHMWKTTPGLTPLPKETFNFAWHGDIPEGGTADDFRQAALEAGAIGLHHWGHREDQINYEYS